MSYTKITKTTPPCLRKEARWGFILSAKYVGNKRRAVIFIDGSNFYFKMKSLEIRRLSKYDYRGLCKELAGDREIVAVGYYVGVVRAQAGDAKDKNAFGAKEFV